MKGIHLPEEVLLNAKNEMKVEEIDPLVEQTST
jgi:hypothetical protein